MKFSICIPNFNYGGYLGETVASALAQTYPDLEVHVADNHSTDDSIAVLDAIDDPRLSYDRNNRNVGFAPNLDRAVAGHHRRPHHPAVVGRPDGARRARDLLPRDGLARRCAPTGRSSPRRATSSAGTARSSATCARPAWCWRPADINWSLSATMGATVYEMSAEAVLERSLEVMRNPVWFASTAYPRALYDEVEGYRGQGLINPDKEFHWRVISAADTVVFVDIPLFSYRVHPSNQDAQQARSRRSEATGRPVRALVQHRPSRVRARRASRADDLARNFIREDIAKRAILSLIERDTTAARRTISFGRAAYPDLMRTDPLALLARGLVLGGVRSTAPVLARVGPIVLRRQLNQKTVIRQALTRRVRADRSDLMAATEPRLRVLFCIPELDRGGPDSVYFNLLRTLDLERFEPFLAVTKPTGAYLSELPDHIPVLAGGPRALPRPLGHPPRAGRASRRRPGHPAHVLHLRAPPARFFPRGTRLICRIANNVSGEIEDDDPPQLATAKTKLIAASYRVVVEVGRHRDRPVARHARRHRAPVRRPRGPQDGRAAEPRRRRSAGPAEHARRVRPRAGGQPAARVGGATQLPEGLRPPGGRLRR